ncbi:hypothetical protein PR002_g26565 [Phytophthora rubi]|uniref:Uncharacterized protein n=1 Tax=Phytophthora rubi TaxID=129364 RepID=A0A6A3HU84_9STRA|nr:hypothetical protein PR002_g26565 [Phytophthora rubi]
MGYFLNILTRVLLSGDYILSRRPKFSEEIARKMRRKEVNTEPLQHLQVAVSSSSDERLSGAALRSGGNETLDDGEASSGGSAVHRARGPRDESSEAAQHSLQVVEHGVQH